MVSIGLEAKGLRKLNQQLGETQRSFKRAFGNIAAGVKRFGQNMTQMVTMPLVGLAAGAIKASADLEKLEVSFISLTGSAENAGAMMSNLNAFTASTPFQIEGVAKAARQLIASGTGIGDVNDQLQFLGDIAATSGTGIEDIAAIFAKVNAKGKVELENLNQLAERGIPIFKALADATGLPASKMGAGAVSVKTFNKVLASFAETGGFAEGAMQRLSQTTEGKLSTAMDNLKLAGAAMAESLMPTIKDIIDGVTAMARRFTSLNTETKETILKIVAVTAAIGPLIMALSALGPAIWAASGPIGLIVLAIAAVVTALVYFRQEIANGITYAVNKFIDLHNEVVGVRIATEFIATAARTTARLFKTQIRSMLTYVGTLGKAMYALFVEWDYDKAKKIIVDGFTDIKEDIIQTGTEIGEDFAGAIERGTKAHFEHVEAPDLGFFDFEGLLNFGDAGPPEIIPMETIDTTDARAERIKKTLQMLAGHMKEVGGAFKDAFGSAFDVVLENGDNMKEQLTQIGRDLMKNLIKIAIGNAIAAAFSPLSADNAASGGLAGVAKSAFLQGLIPSMMPKLARGGLAYGPTMAMVGDNVGARVDPEVIAPLSKLEGMMGGGQLSGRISGRDILLTSSRDRNRSRRTYGSFAY